MRRSRVAWLLGLVLLGLGACSVPTGQGTPPPAPDDPQVLYVAVGASETTGVGADQPLREAWPRVFFRVALPESAVLVNMGIPGATVAQALRQEAPATVDLHPALVTVWLNVNDIIAGVAPAEFERDLGALVHVLRRDGATRVLVANVPPLDHLPAYLACRPNPPTGGPPCRAGSQLPAPSVLNQVVRAYDDATARVVAREGALLVDLGSVGERARSLGTEPAQVSKDGFHPSTAGHEAVARAFADVLRNSGPITPNG